MDMRYYPFSYVLIPSHFLNDETGSERWCELIEDLRLEPWFSDF